LAASGLEIDERPRRRLCSEDYVFGDGQRSHQHEVLVHHAEPESYCVSWPVDLPDFSVDQYLTLVGRVEPVEDVHRGGLARAVFTDDRVNRAIDYRDAYVIIGDEGAEAFCDPSQLDCISRGFGHKFAGEFRKAAL